MKSQNAPFNEFGQSMILRDIEVLYARASALQASAADLQAQIEALGGATSGLGTMALQNADAVAITGGTVSVPLIGFSAYKLGGAATIQASFADVLFSSTDFNAGSVYNAVTGTFTAAVAGSYLVYTALVIATSSLVAGAQCEVSIRLGGTGAPSATAPPVTSLVCVNSSTQVSGIISLCRTVPMTVGQTLTVQAQRTNLFSTPGASALAGSVFTARFIGS